MKPVPDAARQRAKVQLRTLKPPLQPLSTLPESELVREAQRNVQFVMVGVPEPVVKALAR